MDEGGDLRQIQQRQSAGGKHRRAASGKQRLSDLSGRVFSFYPCDARLHPDDFQQPEQQRLSADGIFRPPALPGRFQKADSAPGP